LGHKNWAHRCNLFILDEFEPVGERSSMVDLRPMCAKRVIKSPSFLRKKRGKVQLVSRHPDPKDVRPGLSLPTFGAMSYDED
jgi:hypothetical protein